MAIAQEPDIVVEEEKIPTAANSDNGGVASNDQQKSPGVQAWVEEMKNRQNK